MKVLIRNATIVSPSAPNGHFDILIDNGTITEISNAIDVQTDKIISEEELEKIIRFCEKLVDLEWQLEQSQEKLQANIEIPPKK